MHDVQINLLKNRLYITLRDSNYSDMKKYVNEIESAIMSLVPGFTCLTVLNKEGLVNQSEKDLTFNTMDLVYAYGTGKIAHVRKNNDPLGFFQQSLMGFQSYFQVVKTNNIQEAEDILDGKNSDQ